jgi:hypothetical protein
LAVFISGKLAENARMQDRISILVLLSDSVRIRYAEQLTVEAVMDIRTQKQVSVGIAGELLQVFWPDFMEENGCVLAAFHSNRDSLGKGTVAYAEGLFFLVG